MIGGCCVRARRSPVSCSTRCSAACCAGLTQRGATRRGRRPGGCGAGPRGPPRSRRCEPATACPSTRRTGIGALIAAVGSAGIWTPTRRRRSPPRRGGRSRRTCSASAGDRGFVAAASCARWRARRRRFGIRLVGWETPEPQVVWDGAHARLLMALLVDERDPLQQAALVARPCPLPAARAPRDSRPRAVLLPARVRRLPAGEMGGEVGRGALRDRCGPLLGGGQRPGRERRAAQARARRGAEGEGQAALATALGPPATGEQPRLLRRAGSGDPRQTARGRARTACAGRSAAPRGRPQARGHTPQRARSAGQPATRQARHSRARRADQLPRVPALLRALGARPRTRPVHGRARAQDGGQGGGLVEIPTRTTFLSQRCICGQRRKKQLRERRHRCGCEHVPAGTYADRDELAAFLACFCDADGNFDDDAALRAWQGGAKDRLLRAEQVREPAAKLRAARPGERTRKGQSGSAGKRQRTPVRPPRAKRVDGEPRGQGRTPAGAEPGRNPPASAVGIISEWCEQVLVEVVLAARNSQWDEEQLAALLSPTSLSAALLPRQFLHAILQKRLAQKLGPAVR